MVQLPEAGIAVNGVTALVFASGAIGKMCSWRTLEGVVANYRLLPGLLTKPTAYLLPPLELIIGASLLAQSSGAELAAAAMLLVFAAAIGINLRRGRVHIDCGCFQKTLKQTLRWRLVVRNVGMAALLSGLAFSTPVSAPPDMLTVANGLLGALALFIVWQILNTLWSVVPVLTSSHGLRNTLIKESK
jgi:hypothetical protein